MSKAEDDAIAEAMAAEDRRQREATERARPPQVAHIVTASEIAGLRGYVAASAALAAEIARDYAKLSVVHRARLTGIAIDARQAEAVLARIGARPTAIEAAS